MSNTHSTHYSLSWPCCMCLSVFLAACSVWGVIWKGSIFWKRQRQIVPMMGQGEKWKCRNMMTNRMFGFASVTSIQQYVACSELPASERMEISALPQYLKTRYLTANKQTKNHQYFYSWWINKIWLLKLVLATQKSFRYFLWCVYVWHSCKVCAIALYPASHSRMASKFLQPEADAELKTVFFKERCFVL